MPANSVTTTRLLGNASANIAKVVVNILAAFLLPRILLGTLSVAEYSVWVLIVQISLYSGYLDIGISTVVGRQVAFYDELGDRRGRDQTVSSALVLMVCLAAVAILGIIVVVANIGYFFPNAPADVLRQAAITLLIVGTVTAARLPTGIISAIFIGTQRNEFPLFFVIANKAATIVAVLVAAQMGSGILGVGIAFSLANLVTYAAQVAAMYRFAPEVRPKAAQVVWEQMRSVLQKSLAFAVWTFSGLLISGFDILVVGIYDFAAVASFSFAVTLTTLMTQVQAAAVSVVMPVAAVLTGRQDEHKLTNLLVSTTRYGMLLLLLFGIPMIASSSLIIRLWVGLRFVPSTVPLLIALVIGNLIRQSSLSFTMIVVGVGGQNKILLSPFLGAVVNLTVSILAAMRFGAIGAAVGTIVGGTIEVGLHIYYNLPRITELKIAPSAYLLSGFMMPALCALPGIVVTTLWLALGNPVVHPVGTAAIGIGVALSIMLAGWFFAFDDEDRVRFAGVARRIRMRAPGSVAASS